MGASGFLNSSAPTTNNTANNQNADVQNKAGVNKEEPQQSQAPAPEPAKQEEPKPVNRNITVTNTIIKKVDGKCRYFFTIRNEDKTDFSGSVYIGLLTTNTVGIAGELFDSTEPIQPESGDSVYFDRVTCPTNAGGNAAGYSFEVKENNQVVNSGKNNLTDKFENLDIYK
jgi:hypothetical protein